jgi:hypothetical protein
MLPSMKTHKFTKAELLKVFKHFLNRLVEDYGNNRDEMIAYHIDKLVGLTPAQVLKKMPRGPRNHWCDLMADIRDEIKGFV